MKKASLEITHYAEVPSLEVMQAKFVITFDKVSKIFIQEVVDLEGEIIKAAKKKGIEIEVDSMSIVSEGVVYEL